MTYEEAIEFLYSRLPMYQKIGEPALKLGLRNIIALSDYLQSPHRAYPSIHIAGTNGKGSVAHLVASILQAKGLSVGLYTSPHYRDFRERIKINGKYISEEAVAQFVKEHQLAIHQLRPSYFEVTVAMAFNHFRDEKVDIAVIETGLGGATDSTNILSPILSIITNVSLDHQKVLGDTRGEIAKMKAGIIKVKTPVVIGERHPETDAVFEQRANDFRCDIRFAEDAYQTQKRSENFRKTVFDVYNADGKEVYKALEVGLFGNYQSKNLVTALASVDALNEWSHLSISESEVRAGLANVKQNTNMIGRWDILNEKPLTLTDSGHNESGIQNIVNQLAKIPHQQLHIVLGVVYDKDLDTMLDLLPKSALYYFSKPQVPRGLDHQILKTKANEKGLQGDSFETVQEAWQAAQQAAEDEDLIFIGGSSFVVAEVV